MVATRCLARPSQNRLLAHARQAIAPPCERSPSRHLNKPTLLYLSKSYNHSHLHWPCRVFSPKRDVFVAFATWLRAPWEALTYRGSPSQQPQSCPLRPIPSTLYLPSQPTSTTLIRVAPSSTHHGWRRPHHQSSGGRAQLVRQALQHQWTRLNVCPARPKGWRW